MSHSFIYASSWTHGHGEAGIGLFKLDNDSGELTFLGKEAKNADFNVSCYDRERGIFYALNETSSLPGLRAGGGGRIFVFRADPDTGHLTRLGCTPTWGCNPAYLAIDSERKYMVVANHATRNTVTKVKKDAFGKYYPVVEYDDSTVELFAMNEDGTVGELLDVVYHYGSGPEKRQTNAHPHSCPVSPSGKLFAVCDKGNDTLSFYSIDREKNKLVLTGNVFHHGPGTLPRYAVYHPALPYLYENNEASMDVHAFRYSEEGRLELIGAYSSLPQGHKVGENKGNVYEQQGLVMHPNGRYIYDAVRGPETIAVFEIDESSGALRQIQSLAVEGSWPRGLAISPDGRFMLLCCVDSSDIAVYKVGEDGCLAQTPYSCFFDCAAYATFLEP